MVWEQTRTNKAPLRIEFRAESTESEPYEIGLEEFAKPDVTRNEDWVLAGNFPAQVKRREERDYVLAGNGDTAEKIVERVGAWMPGFQDEDPRSQRMITNQKALAKLRVALERLNPSLRGHGNLPEGMRVEMLTYEEESKLEEPDMHRNAK